MVAIFVRDNVPHPNLKVFFTFSPISQYKDVQKYLIKKVTSQQFLHIFKVIELREMFVIIKESNLKSVPLK